jgi:hypothetical protein
MNKFFDWIRQLFIKEADLEGFDDLFDIEPNDITYTCHNAGTTASPSDSWIAKDNSSET